MAGFVAHEDCEQRYHIGENIREEMKGISQYRDRVGEDSSDYLYGHKDQGYYCDLLKLRDDYLILT